MSLKLVKLCGKSSPNNNPNVSILSGTKNDLGLRIKTGSKNESQEIML